MYKITGEITGVAILLYNGMSEAAGEKIGKRQGGGSPTDEQQRNLAEEHK